MLRSRREYSISRSIRDRTGSGVVCWSKQQIDCSRTSSPVVALLSLAMLVVDVSFSSHLQHLHINNRPTSWHSTRQQSSNKPAAIRQATPCIKAYASEKLKKIWQKFIRVEVWGEEKLSREKKCLALALVSDFCCGENIFQQRNIFLQQQRERGKRAHTAQSFSYIYCLRVTDKNVSYYLLTLAWSSRDDKRKQIFYGSHGRERGRGRRECEWKFIRIFHHGQQTARAKLEILKIDFLNYTSFRSAESSFTRANVRARRRTIEKLRENSSVEPQQSL